MKKGFTLIELLAVIVILAIIALIAIPIVLNIINDSKESALVRSGEFYVSAVENAIMKKNMELGGTLNPRKCIVNEDGNVTCDEINLKVEVDGEKPTSGGITFLEGKMINSLLTFENTTISTSVKGEFIVLDSICELVSDTDGSGTVTIGDKYQCKVKNDMETGFEKGYYFFVLSFNDDGTTNLIMERNIYYDEINDIGVIATSKNTGSVAWYIDSYNNSYGPVTAMNYLYSATKDWNNVPNIIINYQDENIQESTLEKGLTGFGSITTTGITTTIITNKIGEETGKIQNLKARMPKYDEIAGSGKCTRESGSCPLWLSNYLKNSSYVTGEGLENINGIYGYWLLSSEGGGAGSVWNVNSFGRVYSIYGFGANLEIGVRPVITVKL